MQIYKKCIHYTSISSQVKINFSCTDLSEHIKKLNSQPNAFLYTPECEQLRITGPLGEMRMQVQQQNVYAAQNGNVLVLFMIASDKCKKKQIKPVLNTIARHVYNCIIGVTSGYLSELQIIGLGYRASTRTKANMLSFKLGETHEMYLPTRSDQVYYVSSGQAPGQTSCQTNTLMTYGINKHKVYETQAKIKRLSPADRYKGKGIRVAGETPVLKAGKRK